MRVWLGLLWGWFSVRGSRYVRLCISVLVLVGDDMFGCACRLKPSERISVLVYSVYTYIHISTVVNIASIDTS